MISCFEIFSITPTFDIDLVKLEAEYFKAQRLFHPDRFVGEPSAEKMAALQKSMDINQAYEILKNPLKRAQHLLQLQGIIVGTDADSVKPSPALLMEIMEMREQLEEGKLANQLNDNSALSLVMPAQAGVQKEGSLDTRQLSFPSQSLRSCGKLASGMTIYRLVSDLYENSLLDISKYYANKGWQKMAQETLRLGYLVKMLERSK